MTMAQEAALHGSQEPELYFLLFTSQSERACVLGILLNGKIVMAFPRCQPTKQLRFLVVSQRCLAYSEGGQVLDNCGLVQIRDAELSRQAIGKRAFFAEKSAVFLGIKMKLISESGHQ